MLVKNTENSYCCEFTSALNAPSLSVARAPRAHTDSARTVRLHNRQRRLLCEEDFPEQEEVEEQGAMVGTARAVGRNLPSPFSLNVKGLGAF